MMSKKKHSEKELLEGLTPYTAHVDELAAITENEWLYEKNFDGDLIQDRSDVIEKPTLNIFDKLNSVKDNGRG